MTTVVQRAKGGSDVGTTMFQVRLPAEDRRRLQELAARAQRSESEVVRLLLRQADLTRVNTGIPEAVLEVHASKYERKASAAAATAA